MYKNVLLNNCKQNITSLSLLVGTTKNEISWALDNNETSENVYLA